MMLLISQNFAAPAPVDDYSAKFVAWKGKFGKAYSSAVDESKAFAAFAANDDKIVAHNAKGLKYRLGHNTFSDLTAEEFFAQRLGFNKAKTTRQTFSTAVHPEPKAEELSSLAASVDWVSSGAVTPVKDQGQCGSCWSFSATGAMEGAYFKSQGSLLSFSEEDLVQCNSYTDSGCNGGLMDNAFAWVESNGIAAESAYPYTSGTGTTGTCDTSKKSNPVATVGGYVDVTANSQSAMQSAVAQQPVSIAIEADQSVFQLYESGVMDSTSCGTNMDHGVLVVGYDASGDSPYWKVKNSWGSSWGESGYIRLGMASSGAGICGMYQQASYPTGAAPYSAIA